MIIWSGAHANVTACIGGLQGHKKSDMGTLVSEDPVTVDVGMG